MTLAARIVRIERDWLRVGLLAAIFPVSMIRFAIGLAWNAPHRFWLPDPWVTSWGIWRMAADGAFVGMAYTPPEDH